MMQLIFISVAGLLIGNTFADILVQPGYEQPSSPLLQRVVHPFSTLSQGPIAGLLPSHKPGYHMELHPVYGNLGHSSGGLGYLHGLNLSPSQERAAFRRHRFGKLGDHGLFGTHGIIPPHIPIPVLPRLRRSIGEQPNARVQREKRDNDAMATKSTLNGDNPTVVDLLNQDTEEKHVEVRHSKNARAKSSSTLLGLNPSSMYPVQNQYQFPLLPHGSYQQIVNEHPEIASQTNRRVATQEQATPQNHAITSTQNTIPRINPADLQHATLLQQSYPQTETSQTTVQEQQRNYPDPRPVTTAHSSTKAQRNERNKLKNVAESRESKIAVPIDDQEIVGTSLAGHNKVKLHYHGKFIPRSNSIDEAYTPCACSNTGYVVYNGNDETANSLPLTQLGVQQPAQVYQLLPYQENYSPNSGYVDLSQAYSNPIVNCGTGYPTDLMGAYYLPDDNTLPVEYQFG